MTLQIPVMRSLIVLTLVSAGLMGCSHLPSWPKFNSSTFSPYKIDIQQGNFVDQEMVAKLQPGMTRAQVKFVMGTPLVTDIFHVNRWDYIYIYRTDGKVTEQRRAVLYFDGDKLDHVVNQLGADKPVEEKKVEEKKVVPANTGTATDKPAPVLSPTLSPVVQ